MSEAELARRAADRIEAWIAAVDAEWCTLGVPPRDRRAWAVALEEDLDESADAGADVGDLLVDDVAGFAHDLALANGFQPVAEPRDRADGTPSAPSGGLPRAAVIGAALVGGVLGACVAWWVVYPLGLQSLGEVSDLAAAVVLDTTAVVVTLVGVVAGVRCRLRGHPALGVGTDGRVVLGVLAGGAVATGPVVLLSRATAYSTWSPVLLLEAGVVAACCAAGIAVTTRSGRSG